MPDTQDFQEAAPGMSDSVRKAKPIAPPPAPSAEAAAAPTLVHAAADLLSISARQSNDVMRSWEAAVHLGLDGFAAWASARDIWAEGYQDLLRSTFNATHQATKMMVETSAQLCSMGATLVGGTSDSLTGRSGEAR